MKTKYTARFDHIIKASDIIKEGGLSISEASQKELGSYVPDVDFSRSADLLGLAFDVALVNVFNSNGDGISTDGAIKMRPTLTHKPINIEHDRSNVVGHILEGSFTETEFKKRLWNDDVIGKLTPFNITLGGVIYKVSAKQLAEMLVDVQNGKEIDFFVASSWEVGFDSFFAAVGSKYLANCEVITDSEEVEKLAGYMKCFGGKGFLPDGRMVSRLIDPNGTIVFLGAGLTKYPAADVGAVYVFDYSGDSSKAEPVAVKANENEEEISHLEDNDVIPLRTEENMKPEELKKLIEGAIAASASDKSQEAIASAVQTIAEAIVESNKVFVAEKDAAENKAKELEAKAQEQAVKMEELEKKISKANEELASANEKLQKIEDEAKAAQLKEKFNQRMALLDEQFKLEDADREILASKLSAIESDEDFETYKKELEVLMASKLKSKIIEAEASDAQKIKDALAEELKKRGIVDPLEAKAEEKKEEIPNNSADASNENVSLRDRFSKAFDKKNIKVKL